MRAVDVLREVNRAGKPEPMIAGRINVALIRAHWSDILRIIASFRTGTVTASLIMRQPALILTAQRRRSRVARVGPAGERTLFTLVMWNTTRKRKRRICEELRDHDRTGAPSGYHGAQVGQRVGARHARSAREERAALRVAPLPPRK
jgi:Tn3 transposase DDE domain